MTTPNTPAPPATPDVSETTPKWREDFPYQVEADEQITRRDFTRFLLLVSAGLAAGNAWILARTLLPKKPEPAQVVEVARTGELAPGAWRVFHYPDKNSPALLIHRLNGEFVAFQQKCTHLACPVFYDSGKAGEAAAEGAAPTREGAAEALVCHCHNGRFDIETGEGVAGPPRELRPLPRVKLRIEGERILAVGLT